MAMMRVERGWSKACSLLSPNIADGGLTMLAVDRIAKTAMPFYHHKILRQRSDNTKTTY